MHHGSAAARAIAGASNAMETAACDEARLLPVVGAPVGAPVVGAPVGDDVVTTHSLYHGVRLQSALAMLKAVACSNIDLHRGER